MDDERASDRTLPSGKFMLNSISFECVIWSLTLYCTNDSFGICRSLYIASATVFWAFRITEDVKRPIDDMAFVPGIVSHQKPFSLVFEPRKDVSHLREVMSAGRAD